MKVMPTRRSLSRTRKSIWAVPSCFPTACPRSMSVVVPQAANDLLTINGVEASFVAVDTGAQVSVFRPAVWAM